MYRHTNTSDENRTSYPLHDRLNCRITGYGPMSGFDSKYKVSQPGMRWYIRLVPIYRDLLALPALGVMLAILMLLALPNSAGGTLALIVFALGLFAGPVIRRIDYEIPWLSEFLADGDRRRAQVEAAWNISHLMAAGGFYDDQFKRSHNYDPAIEIGQIDGVAGAFTITMPIRLPHTLQKYASMSDAIMEHYKAVRVLSTQASRSRAGGSITFKVFKTDPLTKSRQVGDWAVQPNDLSKHIRIGTNFDGTPAMLDLWQLHGMTAGTTGSGKSASTHVAIMAALSHPKTQVHLIDMKGGLETGVYKDKATSFTSTLRGAVDVLVTVHAEMQRRNRFLDTVGARKAETLSKGGPAAMPAVVVFFDEFARAEPAKADTEEEKDEKALIAYYVKEIAALGRSAGISLNLISQRMSANVISTDARMLFANRISFKAEDAASVTMVLGDSWRDTGLRLDGPVEPGIGLRTDSAKKELVEFRGFYLPDSRIDELAARLPARAESVTLLHPELPSEKKAREAEAGKSSGGGRKPRRPRQRRSRGADTEEP